MTVSIKCKGIIKFYSGTFEHGDKMNISSKAGTCKGYRKWWKYPLQRAKTTFLVGVNCKRERLPVIAIKRKL